MSQNPQTALMMLVLWVDIFSICVWLTECKGFIEPTACRTVAHNDSCIDSTAITANVQGNRLSSSARLRTPEYDPGEDIVVLQGKGSWLVERMQRQIMKWRRQMRRCLQPSLTLLTPISCSLASAHLSSLYWKHPPLASPPSADLLLPTFLLLEFASYMHSLFGSKPNLRSQ